MESCNNTCRNSSFEILRLLAIFMIVLEHCLLATSLHTDNVLSTIDNIAWALEALTVGAVNVFFLISGYFASDNVKATRIIKIWIKIIFYSFIIYLICVIIGWDTLSIKGIITYALPDVFRKYWFMQTYIALAVFMPYIAKMLNVLNQKRHITLIVVSIILFSIHQTFIPVRYTLDATQGYGIIWAITLVIVGNYLKKYGDNMIDKIKTIYFLFGYVVIACIMFVSNYLIVKYGIAQGVTSRANFYAYNSITVFMQSVCLFSAFIKVSKRNIYNKSVNYIASSVLTVYLISAHPDMLYNIWTNLINIESLINIPVLYIIVAIITSLLVVAVCILIDKTIDKLIKFDKISNMISSKCGIS